MKKLIALLGLTLLSGLSVANEPQQQGQEKAKVMLMGVFHFDNPRLDYVKTDQINVMTAENQQYLQRLTHKLSEFQPTVLLLEFAPEDQADIQRQYSQYLASDFQLPVNEIYQLGFRIARKASLQTVYSFDERNVSWDIKPVMDYISQHDTQTKKRFETEISRITQEMQQAFTSKSLKEMLLYSNDADNDKMNKSIYMLTNHVGAGSNFEGADASALWWHRNIRMYANIQRHALPGERVLVIGGQGHTAILKDLLDVDADRIAVDVTPYIRDSE